MNDSDDVVIEETSEEGDEGTTEQKLKKIRDELAEATKEAALNLAGWQRAKADYVNLERRMRSLSGELSKGAVIGIVRSVVGVFDSLEAAARSATDAEVKAGLEGVSRQFEEALKEHGVVRVTPRVGDQFDPVRHESMQVLATSIESEDNTISEAMQSGYEVGDVVIRPARVMIKTYKAP